MELLGERWINRGGRSGRKRDWQVSLSGKSYAVASHKFPNSLNTAMYISAKLFVGNVTKPVGPDLIASCLDASVNLLDLANDLFVGWSLQ